MMKTKLLALLAFGFVLAIANAAAAQLTLNTKADGTGSDCYLKPGKTCFHVFNSTHTATTGDSIPFQVNMCSLISYYFPGDGSASLWVKENDANATSGATIIEYDWDGDGLFTVGDESVRMDGDPGKRSFAVIPKGPYQYIDVYTPPASGSVALAITCQ